jgi:hypothetical protein
VGVAALRDALDAAAARRARPGAGVSPRRTFTLALALVVLAEPAGAWPAPGRLGAQFRYWSFEDGNDSRNPIVYWVPGPFHVQLEAWDYLEGRDQLRPELGVHLRDRRRSSYDLQWRHELETERFTLGTGQVLSDHLVGKASLAALVHSDSTEFVGSAGLDVYWRSYSFAGVDVIRDPRGDDLWVVPMRLRLANESNDWVQFTVAPASRRSLGWAADAKFRWLRLGVEQNSRFDFTTRDNVIFTAGVEFELPARGEQARP